MYLLFDIGGTNMRIAISVNGDGLEEIKTLPTPADFENGVQSIKQVANELLNGKQISKISGGIAGSLDKNKSMLIASPHIGGWVNKLLKQTMEEIFKVEVRLENDAALAGLGEAVYGAGKDYSIIGYIGIGTGVGGAKIVNGKLDANNLGFEPGHQVIEAKGKLCHCGGKGHLESYVAGGYFKENYGLETADLSDEIKEEIYPYLAAGLTNTAVYWSPEVIVLGGSVMNSLSLETIQKHLDQTLAIFPSKILLLKTNLGDRAGLYGSLTLLD